MRMQIPGKLMRLARRRASVGKCTAPAEFSNRGSSELKNCGMRLNARPPKKAGEDPWPSDAIVTGSWALRAMYPM
jgi:hypothetical protein